jgi:non-homologous end joining protein Ku
MATKGTSKTAIAFGDFEITVSMKKAKASRDLKTEYVNEAGEKVTMSGGYGGSRTPAPGVEKAVRISDSQVVRLPGDELARIEDESKSGWSKMQVLEAIDYRQVPTERIEGSYWLQPSQGSSQGLYLLHKGLSDTDKVAVVKWVSTSREKLGVIRPRWIRRGGEMLRALLLSELTFANDFVEPDADALAINEAEAMMEERDPLARLNAIETARKLVTAFARERGDEKHVDTASDTAVDARLALLERLQAEAFERALAATAEVAAGGSAEDGADVIDLDAARAA